VPFLLCSCGMEGEDYPFHFHRRQCCIISNIAMKSHSIIVASFLVALAITSSISAFVPPSQINKVTSNRSDIPSLSFLLGMSSTAMNNRGKGYGAPVDNVSELIGNTPMVKINRLAPEGRTIYVKCEFFNPLSSVKDRLALSIIETAEREGKIKPGDTLIEATSGNTGIAIAMMCAQRGYKVRVIFSPSSDGLCLLELNLEFYGLTKRKSSTHRFFSTVGTVWVFIDIVIVIVVLIHTHSVSSQWRNHFQ
jgi:hypothetical protein